LGQTAPRVVAVEVDSTLANGLRANVAHLPNVEVVNANFLSLDLPRLFGRLRWTVVGNIPYALTSPILFRLLKHHLHLDKVVLTVQKEVAARMLACAGCKEYSLVSVLVQLYCEGRLVRVVPPACFHPRPKVHSAVVELEVLSPPRVPEAAAEDFLAFAKRLFRHRRKQILGSLRRIYSGTDAEAIARVLNLTEVAPTARPEAISVPQLVSLHSACVRHFGRIVA